MKSSDARCVNAAATHDDRGNATVTAPFFVVGFQRSGTTLLRVMLDSHPDLVVPLDTVGLWADYEDRLPQFGNLATDADVNRMVDAILKEERILLWETPLTRDQVLAQRRLPGFAGIIDAFMQSYAVSRGKRRWGDKDPGNMRRIDRLHRWFPDCKIIHIVRDGRDACISQAEQSFGIQDLFDCATAWIEQIEWVRQIGVILGPDRYFELRYEDLVTDAEPLLQRLCEFLSVPWSPAMLEYYKNVRTTVPDSKRYIWPLLDKPPVKDQAGRWKRTLSEGQRVGFEKRAWETLRTMGYETLPTRPSGAYTTEIAALARKAADAVRARLFRKSTANGNNSR